MAVFSETFIRKFHYRWCSSGGNEVFFQYFSNDARLAGVKVLSRNVNFKIGRSSALEKLELSPIFKFHSSFYSTFPGGLPYFSIIVEIKPLFRARGKPELVYSGE